VKGDEPSPVIKRCETCGVLLALLGPLPRRGRVMGGGDGLCAAAGGEGCCCVIPAALGDRPTLPPLLLAPPAPRLEELPSSTIGASALPVRVCVGCGMGSERQPEQFARHIKQVGPPSLSSFASPLTQHPTNRIMEDNGSSNVCVAASHHHGRGLFATRAFMPNEVRDVCLRCWRWGGGEGAGAGGRIGGPWTQFVLVLFAPASFTQGFRNLKATCMLATRDGVGKGRLGGAKLAQISPSMPLWGVPAVSH